MATLNLAPQPAKMTQQERAICGLKRRSVACLVLYFRNGSYRATGADAAEIAFCARIPLSYRKQGYESNFPDHAVTVGLHQIERVIYLLLNAGNPVALVNEEIGEVRECWPEPVTERVDEYWLTLPFRSVVDPTESGTNAEPTPDCFVALQGSKLGDFKCQLTPIEVPF